MSKTSKQKKKQRRTKKNASQQQAIRQYLAMWLGLMMLFIGSIWLGQNSINAYFSQTYHRDSPFVMLNQYPWWLKGGELQTQMYQYRDHLYQTFDEKNQYIIKIFNDHYALTPEYQAQLHTQTKQQQAKQTVPPAHSSHPLFQLGSNDEVFFAGDSMMQGVAPHVQRYLQTYNIKSIDLSKQSTGLSYPSFFDWVTTIKTTLDHQPKIKILMVFLGPNDPWDMPNPAGGTYLKFRSTEWEQLYRERIATIIEYAQQKGVHVIWLGPPNMRKETLNQQMIYLNQVIRDEVIKHHALFIDTRPILGGNNNTYTDSINKDGKIIKLRSSDGIHFSPSGQKLIAQMLEKQLTIMP